MNEFKEKFNTILMETLSVEEEMLQPETTFTELGADSLDTVEVIMEFERVFGITIPDEEAENIQTVGDAETYLRKKLSITF